MQDAIVLQRRRWLGANWRGWHALQSGSVGVSDDCEHTRRGLGGSCVYAADPSSRDGAAHERGVGQVREFEIVGIPGGAGHFARAVYSVHPSADQPHLLERRHLATPVAVCRARTKVRFASSTLNTVPGTVKGSCTAASAAARKASALAGAPRSTSSAAQARQGTVATPPRPIRARRTRPSVIVTATAAEASANS